MRRSQRELNIGRALLLCLVIALVACPGVGNSKTISLKDKADVNLEIDFQTRDKLVVDAGNTTFTFPASHGSEFKIVDAPGGISYRLKITNINVNKYDISFTTKQIDKKENGEKAGSFSKAISDLFGSSSAVDAIKNLLGLKDKTAEADKGDDKAGVLPDYDKSEFGKLTKALDDLQKFVPHLEAFIKMNKAIALSRDTVESYDDFLSDMDKEYKKHSGSISCPLISTPTDLLNDLNSIKVCIKNDLKSVQLRLSEIKRIDKTKMNASEKSHLLLVTPYVEEIGEMADTLEKQLENVITEIKFYLDKPVAQDSLFTYHSDDVTYKDGEFETDLTIRHKEPNGEKKQDKGKAKSCRMAYRLRFFYDSKAESNWYHGFSQGLVVAFVDDRSYTTESDLIVRKGAEEELDPAVAAMFNFGWMVGKNIGFGGSVGVGTDKDELKYYLGTAVALPESRRLFLSLGIAYTRVERLDGYNLGDSFSETTVPTKQVWRTAWYCGITFSLL